MKDPAIAVKELLGSDVSFAVHLGQYPSTPDKVILLNRAGGRPPYPHLAINFPAVQVMVRGAPSGYVAASTEISLICNLLLGIGNKTLNSDRYRSCNQMGDVIYLGQDDRGRPMFSANFWFIVEPSDVGNRVAIT